MKTMTSAMLTCLCICAAVSVHSVIRRPSRSIREEPCDRLRDARRLVAAISQWHYQPEYVFPASPRIPGFAGFGSYDAPRSTNCLATRSGT